MEQDDGMIQKSNYKILQNLNFCEECAESLKDLTYNENLKLLCSASFNFMRRTSLFKIGNLATTLTMGCI